MYMKNPPKIILWQRCLLLRCVCDVLNAMFNLARDVMHFAFCVQLLYLCKVLKTRDIILGHGLLTLVLF